MKPKRIREIKRYGDSRAIKLEPADLKDYDLKEGDMIILDSLTKYKKEENENE